MVALLTEELSLPRPVWALIRHLVSQPRGRQKADDARAVLSPPTLFGEDGDGVLLGVGGDAEVGGGADGVCGVLDAAPCV